MVPCPMTLELPQTTQTAAPAVDVGVDVEAARSEASNLQRPGRMARDSLLTAGIGQGIIAI